MRVIGAGWGRTGTTSAAAALEALGAGPCAQMQALYDHPELAEAMVRHWDGDRVEWRQVLAGYGTAIDWPFCMLWRDYVELWPDAVVLLSLRSSNAWYDSVVGSIHQATAPGSDVGSPLVARVAEEIWEHEFGGWDAVLDRDRAIGLYQEHNAEVRAACPPDRLLEWTVADGWEPLCHALGVPVPAGPFPHLNARE